MPAKDKKDKELVAIGSIMGLLMPLNEGERTRVLEYVLKRLQLDTMPASAGGAVEPAESNFQGQTKSVHDIRSSRQKSSRGLRTRWSR